MENILNNQLSRAKREKILKRLKKLGYNQRTFSMRVLGKRPQQFTQMLNGEQPGLLKVTYEELEKLESQQA